MAIEHEPAAALTGDRSDCSCEERVQIDMSTIRNYSLSLDPSAGFPLPSVGDFAGQSLMLLARTIPAVLKKTGAYG